MTDRFAALPSAFAAEMQRRVGRAFLLALGLALLSVFALGASVLPTALTSNLLVSYAVFVVVFSVGLALFLLRELGGTFGDAIAVAGWARRELEEQRRRIGAGRIPRNAAEARAWLAAHPDRSEFAEQRLFAQILIGDLVAARETLNDYPGDTPLERFELLDDGWFLEFLEGDTPPLDPLQQAAAVLTDESERTHAAVVLATLRAHAAAVAGADWVSPLAAERAMLGEHASGFVGPRYILPSWTLLTAIAAGLSGVALVVGRVTGVWNGP
ncbi:MAG TPA: hypothetical protein VH987_00190 [Candidatus Limnocylindria bacterium]